MQSFLGATNFFHTHISRTIDLDDWIIVIFDNFLVLPHSYVDATAKVRIVLELCMAHRLVLKMQKSWIGTDVVTFFGYEVRPYSWGLSQTRRN